MKIYKLIGEIFFYLNIVLEILISYLVILIIKDNFKYAIEFKVLIEIGLIGFINFFISSFFLVKSTNIREKKRNYLRRNTILLFIIYITLFIIAIFLKAGMGLYYETKDFKEYLFNNHNFMPFKIIGFYIDGYINNTVNTSSIVYNILGNIIIFMPIGYFLFILKDSMRNFKKYFLVMTFLIISVEIIQILTMTGFMDVDDYILNIVGCLIMFLILKNRRIDNLLRRIYILP